MKNLYVSGYRSYELGIFNDKDPKLFYIKAYLKSRLLEYIDTGLEWVLISAQLGTELWVGEIVIELRETYDIKLGVLLPHAGYAENWKEGNRAVFDQVIAKADYSNFTSSQPYQNPSQLKGNQQFLIDHTEGCLLFYDSEKEGKPKFLLDMINGYKETQSYEIDFIEFDELQSFVTDYEENHFES
ncbi:DUF1273 domain-containing protein [Marinilactibacillus sp. Marseille-P9653]|uniref:DUF1273 domain-containing protein n=1 Tax=Marinilactibacillus sp. Marseille-P9653 TaxID=2866583 RepID=UPI001CE3C9BE|nr:DUF1273 domain-containing protein [Marinilactibacillus sp. Marseille-P9653]